VINLCAIYFAEMRLEMQSHDDKANIEQNQGQINNTRSTSNNSTNSTSSNSAKGTADDALTIDPSIMNWARTNILVNEEIPNWIESLRYGKCADLLVVKQQKLEAIILATVEYMRKKKIGFEYLQTEKYFSEATNIPTSELQAHLHQCGVEITTRLTEKKQP
jgi:hypothetical protein